MTTKRMWSGMVAAVLLAALPGISRASDYYWTNTGTAGNFTNAANWGPSFTTVPGVADTANFTNAGNPTVNWTAGATNANAVFNTTNNTTTLAVGAANTWLVTNSFIVGQTASKTATVTQTSGSLVVANDAATARMAVGEAGKGTFTLNGGSLFANQLIVTNYTSAARTNSIFTFTSGTLTTSNMDNQVAASIVYGSDTTFTVSGNWNMLGGSNLVDSWAGTGGSSRRGAMYLVNAGSIRVGPHAVLQVGGSGTQAGLSIGCAASRCLMVVSNGGAVYSGGSSGSDWITVIGNNGGNNNSVLVTGTNSLWSISTSLNVGSVGAVSNSLMIANGGAVKDTVGGCGGKYSSVLVADPGSTWRHTSSGAIIGGGTFNSVVISNGATMITELGNGGAASFTDSNNTLTVTGSGSTWSNLAGGLVISKRANYNGVMVTNGGQIVNIGVFQIGGNYVGNSTGNWAIVTGSGSVLSNSSLLEASSGAPNMYNRLLVDDGAKVYSVGGRFGASGSSFDEVTLQNGAYWNMGGGFLTWGSGLATGNTLTVDSTSWITNAIGLSLNDAGRTVYLTNQTINGGNIAFSGGALNIGTGPNLASPSLVMSNFIMNPTGSVSGGASTIGNGCANITASILSGSLWNGGNQAFTIGSGAGATNNQCVIDGQGVAGGALASNLGALTVGSSTAGSGWNTLIVTNGGQLSANAASIIGSNSSNNTVIIAGGTAASKWDMNNAALTVGGGANTLNSGNLLLIDGCGTSGGAVLTNVSTMGVGSLTGPFNMGLIVTNGGRLSATALTLGLAGAGVSNWVVVAGGAANSLATVGAISVGSAGTGAPYNLLTVDGGGVDGRAGVTNAGALSLGNSGANSVSAFNGVIVTNRGRLSNGSIAVVFRNNYIIVNKGLLTSAGTVALSGTNTSLAVSNGGQVYSAGACTVGTAAGSVSNSISVSGSDSLWDAGNQVVTIGISSGSNNLLTITQGGTVDNVGTLTVVGASNGVNLLGGTLNVKTTTFTNGLFTVGDGVQAATLKSLAGGTLTFTRGLVVGNNATLAGVGTVSGTGTGVLITNGATFAPGMSGAGTLTIGGSNLTWGAGGIYDCAITNLGLSEGSGWSLLNVSSQAVFNGTAGTKLVIKLNSVGTKAVNFNPALNYNIKILSYGGQAGLNTSYISLDTNSFKPVGNVWSLTSTNNALYLTHSGTNANDGANLVWAVPSNGNWSAGANWAGGSAPVAGGSFTNVMIFGDNGTRYSSTNDLPGSFTNNQMLFSSLYPVTNVISGSNLVFVSNGGQAPRLDYLAGPATFIISNAITLTAGSVFGGAGGGTLVLASNVLGGQPLIKEGPWTLALAASNQFSETIMVTAGVIRLDHNLAVGTNSIVVKDGGVLRATAALTLGNGPLLRQASVTGSGSVWTNDALLTVGSNAQVTVDGALLMNPNGVTINNSGALPYALAITNGGVMGFSTGQISIGGSSRSNTVLIADSGSVFMGPGDSGSYFVTMGAAGLDGNTLMIRDGGTFTNARLQFAGASYLAVTNSGRLFTGTLTLGGSTLASVVGGPGVTSVFTTGSPATLSGAAARLVVDGAGVDGSAVVSVTPLSASLGHNNSTIVTNKGRLISTGSGGNYGYGTSTTNNSIVICQGGYAKFSVPNAVYGLGYGNNANSNYMLVRDVGSVLELAAPGRPWRLGLGATGAGKINGNMIYVQNGGLLTNSTPISLASGDRSDDTGLNSFNNGVLVSSGGQVYSSAGCEIGYSAGVTGNFVKVTDSGSYWNMGNQVVAIGNTNALGLSTNNYLMITQDGIMEKVGNLLVYSNNQAYLYGGMLGLIKAGVSNGLPFVAGDGTQAATLKVQGGTLSMSSGLVITNNATLIGSGIVLAPSTVYGTLSLGLTGAGTLTNNGAFTLVTGSESRFDVVTNTGAACDFLAVTNGALTLAGTLTPVLKADFVPAKADRFLIMTNQSGSVSGSFANGTRATIYAENLTTKVGTFKIEQGAQGVVLTDYQVWKSGGSLMIIR